MGLEQRESLLLLLNRKAKKYNLDPRLLDAIVQVESSYDIFATRYEPGFIHLVSPAKFARAHIISLITEETLQKMSWGLGQIMGGTARDLGFTGQIPSLCDPETNLEFVAMYLAKKKEKYPILEETVAAYNAGSVRKKNGILVNQEYVSKILRVLGKG